MIRIFTVLLLTITATNGNTQPNDRKLQQQVDALVKDFNGTIGIYIKDLKKGRVTTYNADTVFPTASIVKVPILIGIMDKMNRGELTYGQSLTYRDSLLYAGVDILGSFKQDEKIELGKLVMLMLTMSDNTASLWLQSLAGTGTRINAILDSMGFVHTRVNSRTPGREANRTQYGWGQSTPREMSLLFEKIYKGDVVSKTASDKMLRLLNRNFFDREAVSQLPPYTVVFTKNGAVNQSRNEVVLVKGQQSTYVFCIMTKNNKDESWLDNNEAWELIRKLSRLLWNYYEPKDKWQPPADAKKFD